MAKDKAKAKKKDKTGKDEIKKKKKKKSSTKTKDAKNKKAKKDGSQTSKCKKTPSPEERIEMIRTAAYYLAEKRGHKHGYELDDWIRAENEIDTASK